MLRNQEGKRHLSSRSYHGRSAAGGSLRFRCSTRNLGVDRVSGTHVCHERREEVVDVGEVP